MVDAFFFLPPKEAQGKVRQGSPSPDQVRERMRPITLRFLANSRKLILDSIGTPLDLLSVNLLSNVTLKGSSYTLRHSTLFNT